MKIKNLRVNGFGKLKNKSIELEDSINIIYGKNEAGKSTLLKYIISMFYGLSKNKNGGTIPEIEKYEPWEIEDFSGRITYELDSKKVFEVYRDFKKKNPKIYNENLEDISKEFNIDKTKGNEFFYEQTGLEEEIFISSIITKQAGVKLNEKEQNTLIQKISNILGTGEDNTSYTTILNKLKKKLNDEVGTSNTKERPINIVENKIKQLQLEKQELDKYHNYKFDIDERIIKKRESIDKLNKELEVLRYVNIEKERLKEKEHRININKEMIDSFESDIDKLKLEKGKLKKEIGVRKISKTQIIVSIVLAIIVALIELLVPNIIAKICAGIALIVNLIVLFIKNNTIRKIKQELIKKQKDLDNKIKILEQNKAKQLIELSKIKEEYENDLNKKKSSNGISNLDNILEVIDSKQRTINEQSLELHTLNIDNNNVIHKLEKLVNVEEELESLKEESLELNKKRDNIKKTIEYLEIAYNKMKEQITPKFTKELSKAMEKISNGKYKNVRINTNGEIIVEQENGEYINAENLSIGTIDQLYLSLRLATIKEISKENMPIILDEAFAYYDDKRLENILKYLSSEYNNKQVVIFTCTNREKQILEKMQIKYNLIEL